MPFPSACIACAQAGFDPQRLVGRDQPYYVFASVHVALEEAKVIVEDVACRIEAVLDGSDPDLAAETIDRLRGRFKISVQNKLGVLVDIFNQRIVVPVLKTGDVVPFIRDPERTFKEVLLKRIVASEKTPDEIAAEMEDFVIILHDLSVAPTLFCATNEVDDMAMKRIMSLVDRHWVNVRGFYDIGPQESVAELLEARLNFTSASRHLTAWIDRGARIEAIVEDIGSLRAVSETFAAPSNWTRVLPDHLVDPRRHFAPSLVQPIALDSSDPRVILAKVVATATVDCRSGVLPPLAGRLARHAIPGSMEVETDTLDAFVDRSAHYGPNHRQAFLAAVSDQQNQQASSNGFAAPERKAACTWLDELAFRLRADWLRMLPHHADVPEAMVIRSVACLLANEQDPPSEARVEVVRRFLADLRIFFDPDFADIGYAIALSPGFSRELEGREASERDVSAILAHLADKPYTYIDCPSGSFEVADGVKIRAILARAQHLVGARTTYSIDSPDVLVIDAVIGREGMFADRLLSWKFGKGHAVETPPLDASGQPLADSPDAPFALLLSSGRTIEGLLREVEIAIASAIWQARYRPRLRPLRRLLRIEAGDPYLFCDHHHPRQTMLDVVQLESGED